SPPAATSASSAASAPAASPAADEASRFEVRSRASNLWFAEERLPGDLVHEAVDVDDDAGHATDGDEAALVADRHGEGDPPAVDLLDGRLGGDGVPDAGRRQVIELHLHPDAGLPHAELVLEREHGGLLAQRHDARGGEHRDAPAPERDRGVLLLHHELDLG